LAGLLAPTSALCVAERRPNASFNSTAVTCLSKRRARSFSSQSMAAAVFRRRTSDVGFLPCPRGFLAASGVFSPRSVCWRGSRPMASANDRLTVYGPGTQAGCELAFHGHISKFRVSFYLIRFVLQLPIGYNHGRQHQKSDNSTSGNQRSAARSAANIDRSNLFTTQTVGAA